MCRVYTKDKKLKESNQTTMLEELQNAVTVKEIAKGQLHKVFKKALMQKV